MQSSQSVGQFKVSTSSRGNPKGRSKPPTHDMGCCNHCAKASSEAKRSSFVNWTRPPTRDPKAKTIGFLREGLLEKSQPKSIGTLNGSRATNDAGGRHQLFQQRQGDAAG